jgi:Trp operon repressor
LDDQKVEFFTNILVDSEMPEEVIARLNIQESTLKGTIARTQLSRNLYTSDNEEPC